MTILVAMPSYTQSWVERLTYYLPDRAVYALGEPFDRRSIHYVAAWNHPEGSLSGLPNLSVIFSLGAGVDHLLADLKLPDVPVVRMINPDLTARMSEYVILHCLSYLRKPEQLAKQQKEKRWYKDYRAPSAADVRVGIMGYGVLGQDAAHKLKMIGFDVAGWVRTPREQVDIPLFAGNEGLDPFLHRTDILVCLLPFTSETKGILNLSLFEKLAQDGVIQGPFLINCGRGGCQNEADILTALNTGILKGATLDVFEYEPLPEDSPLWHHPLVTVTPHNSAVSNPEQLAKSIADMIQKFEAGEPLEGIVRPERGY